MGLQRVQDAARCAVACERATGVPAELTIAQWALESGWGHHQPDNNCFGIKAYAGCYGVQLLETTEVINGATQTVNREFATFPTLAACFEKHAQLISQASPYRNVWKEYEMTKDLHALVVGVAPIYATGSNYAETLLAIIAMPEVTSALANARGEAS